jgi:hypothetical protein
LLTVNSHPLPCSSTTRDGRPTPDYGRDLLQSTQPLGARPVEVLYTVPGPSRGARWIPYVGAGPNFALSHRGLDSDELDDDDDPNRFDFSDTDFEGGVNVIAGAHNPIGMFLEMKATAYGVSNVRLLVGFKF